MKEEKKKQEKPRYLDTIPQQHTEDRGYLMGSGVFLHDEKSSKTEKEVKVNWGDTNP